MCSNSKRKWAKCFLTPEVLNAWKTKDNMRNDKWNSQGLAMIGLVTMDFIQGQ